MTTANVCIVESLEFMDEPDHREGEILYRTLRLAGKRPHYSYVRSSEELQSFFKEFGESKYRYLHLSCHGDKGSFYTTTDHVPSEEMVEYIGKNLKGRRLFVSACSATNESFARAVMERGECHSVLGPTGDIRFDDAAIFWTAFYHLMLKISKTTMQNAGIEDTVRKCAELIGEEFVLYYWKAGKVRIKTFAS